MLEKSYDDFYSRNVFWTLKMEVNEIWILYDFRSDVAYNNENWSPDFFLFLICRLIWYCFTTIITWVLIFT